MAEKERGTPDVNENDSLKERTTALNWSKRIYFASCVVLILMGVSFFIIGLNCIINDKPQNEIPPQIIEFYFFEGDVWGHYTIKMETHGAFIANNPINVTMTTSTPMDIDKIRSIQIEFLGGSKYFPRDYDSSPPSPPSWNASKADREQYDIAMEEYWKNFKETFDKEWDASQSNLLFLHNDSPPTASRISTFSGSLENLVYPSGGQFDIGITANTNNGVVGYGLGDTSYLVEDIITISPPETLLQMQSNSIMTGLGWIGIGIPFFLGGLIEILGYIKRRAFPLKNHDDESD